MRRRLFLFPTEYEAAAFREAAPKADIRITGVGQAATAATVAKALREGYKHMVLAGIAGSYDEAPEPGEVFAVSEERLPGLPSRFARAYKPATMPKGLPTAVSNTVQLCGAEPQGAKLENMEGAVFFAMCEEAGVKDYCEIRAVSNKVGAPAEEWESGVAIEKLTDALIKTFIKQRVMNKTKIILWAAAAVIVIAAAALLAAKWKYWSATILTWVIVIGVSFLAGWLIGRFGGKKNKKSDLPK